MTQYRFRNFLSLGLAAAIAAPLSAQEAPDEPDPEAKAAIEAQGFRLPPQLRQVAYRDANPWVLHTNVRLNEGDSSVTFGGLGAIPFRSNVPGADLPDVPVRLYDDGAVGLDAPRDNEVDDDGNQTSPPGGRYQTFDEDGNVTGDFLSYTPGVTRDWAYQNQEQFANGTISMNSFSTESTGASIARDAETSGLGFELAVSRRLIQLGRKLEIGLSGAVGFSDFNASTTSTISADLIRLTDVYQISGTPPDAPYQAPSFIPQTIIGPDGLPFPTGNSTENTVPLQQLTADRRFETVPDGATVNGAWGLDGAYYSFRFGPEVRGHLTQRIAFTAGAGVLGAVVGSDFSVAEALVLEDYQTFGNVSFISTDTITELVFGYYAEIALEYWITQRTGLFFGAAIESIDDFNHVFGGRTASVMLGDSTVVRIGVIHRF